MPEIEAAVAAHIRYIRLINGVPDDDPAETVEMKPVEDLGDYLRSRRKV